MVLSVDDDLDLTDVGKLSQGVDDRVDGNLGVHGVGVGEEGLVEGHGADIVAGQDVDELSVLVDGGEVEVAVGAGDDLLDDQSLHGNVAVVDDNPVGLHQFFPVL